MTRFIASDIVGACVTSSCDIFWNILLLYEHKNAKRRITMFL